MVTGLCYGELRLALVGCSGGLLGDRLDRTHIIAFGCFLWGVMTMAIGLSTTLTQACITPAATRTP